jgi:hypothetical protein
MNHTSTRRGNILTSIGSAVLIGALLVAYSTRAYAIEEVMPCGKDGSLRLWDANDSSGRQVRGAEWYFTTAGHFDYGCGFYEVGRISLGDLALWSDPRTAAKGVWVFRGVGDHCSQNQLLIYNESTRKVVILNSSDMSSVVYQCRGE